MTFREMIDSLKENEYIVFSKKEKEIPCIKVLFNPTEDDLCIHVNEEKFQAKVETYDYDKNELEWYVKNMDKNDNPKLRCVLRHTLKYHVLIGKIIAIQTPLGVKWLLGERADIADHGYTSFYPLLDKPSTEREWISVD